MHLGKKGLTTTALLAASLASNLLAADTAQETYKTKCQMCHGPSGEPTAVGKSMGARPFSDPGRGENVRCRVGKHHFGRQEQDAGIQREASRGPDQRSRQVRERTEMGRPILCGAENRPGTADAKKLRSA